MMSIEITKEDILNEAARLAASGQGRDCVVLLRNIKSMSVAERYAFMRAHRTPDPHWG